MMETIEPVAIIVLLKQLLIISTNTERRTDRSSRSINHSGEHVTKDELRAELERQAQRYKDVYGGEVVTYAAQPDPERKPWRKRPSLLDQAFQQELQKIEQAREAE